MHINLKWIKLRFIAFFCFFVVVFSLGLVSIRIKKIVWFSFISSSLTKKLIELRTGHPTSCIVLWFQVNDKSRGYINKLVVTCLRSGLNKPFRDLQKPERTPIRALRTSSSGRLEFNECNLVCLSN